MSVDHDFTTPRHGEPYGKPKVSVVITTRNEYPQIYVSIYSILEELVYWGYPFEFIIVSNLCEDGTPDIIEQRYGGVWRERGRLKVVRYNDKGSIDCSRNAGVAAATGDVIYFSDAHMSVTVGTIHGLIQAWLKHGGMWYPCINCWTDWEDLRLRAYNLTLEANFWGTQSFDLPSWAVRESDRHIGLYTMGMGSHATILLGRQTFNLARGFHPGFKTYAGGEGYLAMKLWRLGVKSWMNPNTLVRHDNWGLKVKRRDDGSYDHGRGYGWTNSEVWYNFMLSAYTVGGEEWMDTIYQGCVKQCNGVAQWINELTSLRDEIRVIGEEDRLWIQDHAWKGQSMKQMVDEQPWNDPALV